MAEETQSKEESKSGELLLVPLSGIDSIFTNAQNLAYRPDSPQALFAEEIEKQKINWEFKQLPDEFDAEKHESTIKFLCRVFCELKQPKNKEYYFEFILEIYRSVTFREKALIYLNMLNFIPADALLAQQKKALNSLRNEIVGNTAEYSILERDNPGIAARFEKALSSKETEARVNRREVTPEQANKQLLSPSAQLLSPSARRRLNFGGDEQLKKEAKPRILLRTSRSEEIIGSSGQETKDTGHQTEGFFKNRITAIKKSQSEEADGNIRKQPPLKGKEFPTSASGQDQDKSKDLSPINDDSPPPLSSGTPPPTDTPPSAQAPTASPQDTPCVAAVTKAPPSLDSKTQPPEHPSSSGVGRTSSSQTDTIVLGNRGDVPPEKNSTKSRFFSGLWRAILLPLTIAEGVGRLVDLLSNLIWKNWGQLPWEGSIKGVFKGIAAIFVIPLRLLQFATLFLFVPEKLIKDYLANSPKLAGLVRIGNIVAWICIGIFAFPPVFAKIGTVLPIYWASQMETLAQALSKILGYISATQVFWGGGLGFAYTVRCMCSTITERWCSYDIPGDTPAILGKNYTDVPEGEDHPLSDSDPSCFRGLYSQLRREKKLEGNSGEQPLLTDTPPEGKEQEVKPISTIGGISHVISPSSSYLQNEEDLLKGQGQKSDESDDTSSSQVFTPGHL